jgi:hypothetical protein
MATTNSEAIRVIAFREGDKWIAQCLEYDISAQGVAFQDAMRRLTLTVNAEFEYTREKHGEAFANIAPAPEEFEAMFATIELSLQSDNLEWKIAA